MKKNGQRAREGVLISVSLLLPTCSHYYYYYYPILPLLLLVRLRAANPRWDQSSSGDRTRFPGTRRAAERERLGQSSNGDHSWSTQPWASGQRCPFVPFQHLPITQQTSNCAPRRAPLFHGTVSLAFTPSALHPKFHSQSAVAAMILWGQARPGGGTGRRRGGSRISRCGRPRDLGNNNVQILG